MLSPRRRLLAASALVSVVLAGCSAASDTSTPATAGGATTTIADRAAGGSGTATPSTVAVRKGWTAASLTAPSVGALPVSAGHLDLRDESRETQANGDAPAHAGRDLPVTIVYPAAGDAPGDGSVTELDDGAAMRDGRYPLIVFSHGVTAKGEFYINELRAFASAGYVVVAPDYPLSNADAPGGPVVKDMFNQGGDVSFLLDRFTESSGPAAAYAAHVDAERIGVAGHSLGAITSLIVGEANGQSDDRIKAIVSWAGFLASDPGDDAATKARPVLLIHGTEDRTLNHDFSVKAFAKIPGPRWFITLPGAGHVPPYIAPNPKDPQSMVVTAATVDFFDAFLKDDPKGIDRMDETVEAAGTDEATIQHAG